MQKSYGKGKTLLLSFLIVVLCVSVIIGATFALFSDKEQKKIGVQSGEIDVIGTVSMEGAWSQGQSTDERVAAVVNNDGEGNYSATVAQGGAFSVTPSGDISLNNISLGDGAAFKLIIENASTVAVKYRVYIDVAPSSNKELVTSLAFNTGDGSSSYFAGTESTLNLLGWTEWESGSTQELSFEISLPWSKQPVFDNAENPITEKLAADFTLYIEAVQANAFVEDFAVNGTNADSLEEVFDVIASDSSTNEFLVQVGALSEVKWPSNAQTALAGKDVTIIGAGVEYTSLSGEIIVPENTNIEIKGVAITGNISCGDSARNVSTFGLRSGATANVVLSNVVLVTEADSTVPAIDLKGVDLTLSNSQIVLKGAVKDANLAAIKIDGAAANLSDVNIEATSSTEGANSYNLVGIQAVNGAQIYGESINIDLNTNHYAVSGAQEWHNFCEQGIRLEGSTAQILESTIKGGAGVVLRKNSSFTMNGGAIDSIYYAVTGNNLTGKGNATLLGVTLTSEKTAAIYIPMQGEIVIGAGSVVQGPVAIEAKMGRFTITDTTLISTADAKEGLKYAEATGGNSEPDGSVIMLNTEAYNGDSCGGDNSFVVKLGEGVVLQSEAGKLISVYKWNKLEQTRSFDFGGYADEVHYYVNVNDVAQKAPVYADGEYYATLAEASGAASIIILADNTAEEAVALAGKTTINVKEGVTFLANITVAEGSQVTIEGAGTIRGADAHTIINNGTLIINGDVVIDNIKHAKAAVYNASGAKFEMNGGWLMRSAEAGKSPSDNGGNSYYVLENKGIAFISAGTISYDRDYSQHNYSSLIENGWADPAQNISGLNAEMTITGGYFNGGLNTVKNDDYGVMAIEGGVFEGAFNRIVLNWNVLSISGGEFKNAPIMIDNDSAEETSIGQLTITGGEFAGEIYIYNTDSANISDATIIGNGSGTGIYIENASVTLKGGTISGFSIGVFVGSRSNATVSDFKAEGVTFSNISSKGIYGEAIGVLEVTGCTFTNAGTVGDDGMEVTARSASAIDVNQLKAGTRIKITGNKFVQCGDPNGSTSGAIKVKVRNTVADDEENELANDGDVTDIAAGFKGSFNEGVTISGNTFEDTQSAADIVIGTAGNDGKPNTYTDNFEFAQENNVKTVAGEAAEIVIVNNAAEVIA